MLQTKLDMWNSRYFGIFYVKMGFTDLRDSHCVSVALIKAFSVSSMSLNNFPFE